MFDNKLQIWKHSFLTDLYRAPVVNRTEDLDWTDAKSKQFHYSPRCSHLCCTNSNGLLEAEDYAMIHVYSIGETVGELCSPPSPHPDGHHT